MDTQINKICMITIHGHVESRPSLGKTDTGGQVTYVLELSKALAKKGIKVDIYTRKFRNRESIEKVSRGVRIIRIPCGGVKFIPKEQLLPHLDNYVHNMEKFIKKEGLSYEIYHSHYWDAGYVAMKLAEKKDIFFAQTFHSLGEWKKANMPGSPSEMERLYRFKERIETEKSIFERTNALVMTSPDMLKIARKFYNYKRENYTVLPAGVNMDIFRPLKAGEKEKKINVPDDYVFWVGRLDTNKGLDVLLEGFAQAASETKDLCLVIGGGSEDPKPKEKELKKKLESIIRKNKIHGRVFFTGHIEDPYLPAYFRKAAFFILPSSFEPFGMTAAEAIACGTPLAVSNRAGITRYLFPGKDCITIDPSDKKAIARALKKLNGNKVLLAGLSRNGLKTARQKFTWDSIAGKSISYYRSLLK